MGGRQIPDYGPCCEATFGKLEVDGPRLRCGCGKVYEKCMEPVEVITEITHEVIDQFFRDEMAQYECSCGTITNLLPEAVAVGAFVDHIERDEVVDA